MKRSLKRKRNNPKEKRPARARSAAQVLPSIAGSGEFLNRDLSWLEFNARVLDEALKSHNPLLERLRFLGIFSSNLDEFFMKRVGGLQRQVAAGITTLSPDGRQPQQILAAIRSKILPLLEAHSKSYLDDIKPKLKSAGVEIVHWKDLASWEKDQVTIFFKQYLFPVLTPLAVDPGHPFPFLSNLSTSLAVAVSSEGSKEKLFARVKIPKIFPGLFQIKSPNPNLFRFVSLQEIVEQHIEALFPKMKILGVMPFRITRNADIERDEEDAEDLLEMIEEELRQRRFAKIVRLEIGPKADPWLKKFIVDELELSADSIYEVENNFELTIINQVFEVDKPHLKFVPWAPTTQKALQMAEDTNIFSILKSRDILVHHPYESFSTSVEKFVRSAVDDPKVLAIKMALYRTGDNSPFVPMLIEAAERGKQVVCLVELKARFDEERNILWAQKLEDAGVHVVYGIVGLKTHAKTTLIIRNDDDGLRTYFHLGTGNYHSGTAKLYTDIGLMSSQPDLALDIVNLFHYLTGRSQKSDYNKLLVAPVNMKDRFLKLIEREAAHAAAGRPAQIIAKMNSFDCPVIARALILASQKGVDIKLIIRGFCTLRPQVKGITDNIKVYSIIGRFLEHSRIFFFRNGNLTPRDGDFFIGSADWMDRNLNNRVEAIAPVMSMELKEKCLQALQVMIDDQRQCWEMKSDGSYVRRTASLQSLPSGQEILMEIFSTYSKKV